MNTIPLHPNHVDVWLISLDVPDTVEVAMEKLLSDPERVRAENYRFERDRSRFVVARGFLRAILSRYSGMKASAIAFQYGSEGKPYLETSSLSFNVSHSRNLAAYAVTHGPCELGIDVEWIRPEPLEDDVHERFFSGSEVEELLSLKPEERIPAFFRCWTRKEAFLKGRGGGLTTPLDLFSVSLLPGHSAAILSCRIPTEGKEWKLYDLTVPAGYCGALAVEGDWRQIRAREMTEFDDILMV